MLQTFYIILFVSYIRCAESSPVVLNVKGVEDDLVAVISISRHGDRTPLSSFPTDQFFNGLYWPMGFGQLTQVGIKRHYNLGKWLRKRYNAFLGELYTSNKFLAQSTDTDRTLMSALANLAGLFPPKNFQVWNKDILWQPIPVHIADYLSFIEKKGCEKYQQLLNETKISVYKKFHEKHSKVFEFIANHTGWKQVTVDEVEFLMDVFSVYREHNESFIPSWASKLDTNLTSHLAGVVYEIQSHTTPLARLRIGVFYDKVFKFFDNFVKSLSSNNPKFFMVTAHESTLSAVLNAMGEYKLRQVGYGDTVIFELKKTKGREHYVNVLYKRGEALEKLNIKNCEFNCDFEAFRNHMVNVTVNVNEWYKECGHIVVPLDGKDGTIIR